MQETYSLVKEKLQTRVGAAADNNVNQTLGVYGAWELASRRENHRVFQPDMLGVRV